MNVYTDIMYFLSLKEKVGIIYCTIEWKNIKITQCFYVILEEIYKVSQKECFAIQKLVACRENFDCLVQN